ncbi:hypothetical protein ASG87_09795 [Frateuria sp. Soil773]|uniref:LysR family transcriptional regulator n=1 Tax=Frateuria sp. Soil773 TaxID=1736407 RepID=UPI0006F3FF2B|nr:LysR family transcriptional regulator [Frateuria sp. Soil773]KRF01796.1 hypothetical protein ASG87_09795 [Frateuria sp. Soil773]
MDQTGQLANLYLLTRVIDAGGFSAAAREMGTTRSLLSRRIIALEQQLGARLLHRDARRFAVTAVGEQVYRQAVLMCEAAQAAVAVAREAQGPAGLLRVDMPGPLSPLLSGVLAEFADRNPQLRLAASASGGADALLRQRADVALSLGSALPDSGDIVARPLGSARLVMVASPELLQQLDHPRHPDNVEDRHCLGYTGHGLAPDWQLRGTTPRRRHARLVSDHLPTVLASARAGMGFAQLPMYACHEDLASGRLQLVFEAFEARPLPLHALTMAGHASGELALGLIRFVREQLARMPALGLLPA